MYELTRLRLCKESIALEFFWAELHRFAHLPKNNVVAKGVKIQSRRILFLYMNLLPIVFNAFN